MNNHTIEDYKLYTRKLKKKILVLQQEKENLSQQMNILEKRQHTLANQEILRCALKMSKKATVIQRHFKGFLQRRKFRVLLAKLISQKTNTQRSDDKTDFEVMQNVKKKAEKIGLNMEMLYRACKRHDQQFINTQQLQTFLKKLPISLKESEIQKFMLLLDEDFKGKIEESQYQNFLVSYGLYEEDFLSQIFQKQKELVVNKVCLYICQSKKNLDQQFSAQIVQYKEFANFLETSQQYHFKDSEKQLLLRILDRRNQGYIHKSNIIELFGNCQDRVAFKEIQDEVQESINICQQAENVSKKSEEFLYRRLIFKLQDSNKSIGQFFDVLSVYIINNKKIIEDEDNLLSIQVIETFLNDSFQIVLGAEFTNSFIECLFESSIKFKSNFEKRRIQRDDNKYSKTKIDILELKNKLINYSNQQENTIKILLVLRAVKLDNQNIETIDFFKKFGYDLKRKVNFQQFFIIAQKILNANFQEIQTLYEMYDQNKEGMFSLQKLLQDINKYRSEEFQDNNNSKNTIQNIQIIIDKIKKIKSDWILCFMGFVQQKPKIIFENMSFQQFQNFCNDSLNQELQQQEIQILWEFIDINKNQTLEFYEITDFIVQNFGNQDDIIQIYTKGIGVYLDSTNQNTTAFFQQFGLNLQDMLTKKKFGDKLKVSLNINYNTSEIIFNFFKKNGTDKKINLHFFIEAINKNRKIKISEKNQDTRQQKNNNRAYTKSAESLQQSQHEIDQYYQQDSKIKQTVEKLIQENEHEILVINQAVIEKNGTLNLLQLKRLLRENFDKNQTTLLLNYFKQSDFAKNGYIETNHWTKLLQELGILKPEKKHIKIDMSQIKNKLEFYKLLQQIKKEQQIQIDYQIICELSEYENTECSIIKLKRELAKIDSNLDLKQLIKLMTFFDEQKNGLIKFNDFKLLLILLNQTNSNEILDVKVLLDNRIGYDEIAKYFQQENQSINLISLLQNLIQYLSTEQEMQFASIISRNFNKNQSIYMNYDSLMQELKLTEIFNTFKQLLNENQNNIQVLLQLRKIIIIDRKKNITLDQLIKKLSTSDKDLFNEIYSKKLQNKTDQDNFVKFILLADWNQLEKKLDLKNSIQNNFKKSAKKSKLVKQGSSLKEDRYDLVTIATNKLMDTFNRKDIKTIIKLVKSYFVSDYDSQVNFIKFKDMCKAINKSLKADEILKLFNYLDNDSSHTISREEFENYLRSNFKRMQTLNLKKSMASKSLLEIEENVCKDIKMSQVESQIQNQLETFEILPEHYYNNRKTVFTDINAVLKVCINLASQLSKAQEKYNDPEFGPQQDDEFGENSIYANGVTPGGVLPEDIVWLRPEQISQEKTPVFLDCGASANDVIQGQLGDCWLIGALSMLALDDSLIYHEDLKIENLKNQEISDKTAHELIHGVYPKLFHFLSKYGIFVFKFFKNCKWLYIIIDDKIPCFSGSLQKPQIVFAKCHSRNEFWVPLIEKAYAKLHGNYNALVGGQLDDALVDMTGRVSEKLKLMDSKGKFDLKTHKSPQEFFQTLNQEIINKSMMGCSIAQGKNVRGEGKVYKNDEFIGLFSGHAYSLMDVIDLGFEKVVRIRNPWGSENPVEWNGPWSDNSPELIQNLKVLNDKLHSKWGKEVEELHEENKDGAFLMSYQDFIEVWHNISICKKFPTHYEAVRFFGEWNEKNSGGTPVTGTQEAMINYAKNTQYVIEIQTKTHLFVSLGQEDGRMKSLGEERFPYENIAHYMSLLVFKLEKGLQKLKCFDGNNLLSQPFLKVNRDIQLSIELEKGRYCVVPATKDENQFGLYHISFYYSCQKNLIKIIDAETKQEGEQIQEESEEQVIFSKDFKNVLSQIVSVQQLNI